jgi:hypothetical protein
MDEVRVAKRVADELPTFSACHLPPVITMSAAPETFGFQAEISQLLDLIMYVASSRSSCMASANTDVESSF